MELLENTGSNEHNIKLQKGKQPPYRPIYSLGLVELETLKIYIETYLKTGFIQPFKFPAGASILLNKKQASVKRSTYYQARLIEGDAQRERKKSRVCHVMTPRSLGAPKSCAFRETLKMCAIDSIP